MIQTLSALIALLVPFLIARVLVALGLTIVTITGVNSAYNILVAQVISHLGAVPASILMLFGLAGIGQGLGIVFGAMTYRLALYVFLHGRKMVGL